VILDLTIRGGMGGVEAFQQLLKIDPHVKAVVSSGYSDDATIANHMSQGFKASLKKPYDVSALREVLNKVLNG
jgi:DNA-binding NtrC family response regulator